MVWTERLRYGVLLARSPDFSTVYLPKQGCFHIKLRRLSVQVEPRGTNTNGLFWQRWSFLRQLRISQWLLLRQWPFSRQHRIWVLYLHNVHFHVLYITELSYLTLRSSNTTLRSSNTNLLHIRHFWFHHLDPWLFCKLFPTRGFSARSTLFGYFDFARVSRLTVGLRDK